ARSVFAVPDVRRARPKPRAPEGEPAPSARKGRRGRETPSRGGFPEKPARAPPGRGADPPLSPEPHPGARPRTGIPGGGQVVRYIERLTGAASADTSMPPHVAPASAQGAVLESVTLATELKSYLANHRSTVEAK